MTDMRDHTINLVPVDGPRHGGVVQFANWPWPGICMRGDTAGGRARLLRYAADQLDRHLTTLVLRAPDDARLAPDELAGGQGAIQELREFADELLKCVVDQDYIRRPKQDGPTA